jgi:hypothetical protein
MMLPNPRAVACAAAVATLLLAGCGDNNKGSAALPSTPPATSAMSATAAASATPTATTTASVTAEPPADASPTASAGAESGALADGRHPAHLTKVNATGRTVTFDVIQFLTGAAAQQAAKEDGGGQADNDYWIRNVNPMLRTLPVAADVTITVNVLAAETSGDSTKDVPVTLTKLAAYDHLADAVFWLTVAAGKITKIAEQFLP